MSEDTWTSLIEWQCLCTPVSEGADNAQSFSQLLLDESHRPFGLVLTDDSLDRFQFIPKKLVRDRLGDLKISPQIHLLYLASLEISVTLVRH